MRWNRELWCYGRKQHVSFSAADMELEHRHGCCDCINKDTCLVASRLGLPCEDWEGGGGEK
jgi:hypothetical protein